MPQVETQVLRKVVQFIGGTMNHLQKEAAVNEQIAADAPGVADVLVSRGLIEPHQKEAAIESLKNPVKALEILKAAASKVSDTPSPMGSPAEKEARSTDQRESDRVFLERLGLIQ